MNEFQRENPTNLSRRRFIVGSAAAGGGLALLKTGDRVRIDLGKGTADILISEEELAERRAELEARGEMLAAQRRCVQPGEPQPAPRVTPFTAAMTGFVNSPNAGIAFVVLRPAEERQRPELSAGAIVGALNQQFFVGIQESIVAIFPPPPVQGLGQVGGFKLYVEDRAGNGFEDLYASGCSVHGCGAEKPTLYNAFVQLRLTY